MHQIDTRSSPIVVGSDKNHHNFIAADHTGKFWLHVFILLSWRTMRSTVKRGKVSLVRSPVINTVFVRNTWNWHSTRLDWHSLVWKNPELDMTSRILSTSFCPFFWDTRYLNLSEGRWSLCANLYCEQSTNYLWLICMTLNVVIDDI